jgi:hypothetical protein
MASSHPSDREIFEPPILARVVSTQVAWFDLSQPFPETTLVLEVISSF